MLGTAKQSSRTLWIPFGAIVVLLLGVVLPPLANISRYQHKIAASISRSLGRPVHISSMELRLLPLPGFEFSGFTVGENPEFGAEPILRCGSVIAYLRLASLWRGRLEFSRIHLDGASLNLVRNPDGSWNFASILLQAARTSNAPTAQRYASRAPRFPYIEAVNSRINFKEGDEKKPLSFLNADLSVWLNSPDEWEVRFQAQPVRTDLDMDLGDTGVLSIEGTLHRAATLGEMPLKLNARWNRAPLGQLSRLTMGRDSGWRGGLDVETQVEGTAELARISTRIRVNGLHRAEFAPAQPLDLDASCHASYHRVSASIEEIACLSPVGDGQILFTGSAKDLQSQPQVALALEIQHLPASAVLAALQEVRNGVDADLQVSGTVNGHLSYASSSTPSFSNGAGEAFWGGVTEGEMDVSDLTLTAPDSGRPFSVASMRLLCESPSATAAGDAVQQKQKTAAAVPVNPPPALQPAFVLQPVRLALGAPAWATMDGRFTPAGFDIHLNGPSTLARLRTFNRVFGLLDGSLPPLRSDSSTVLGGSGTATLNLDIRGSWVLPVPNSDFPVASSTAEGSITLHNAELAAPYLSQPLKMESAEGILSATQMEWSSPSIHYGTLEVQGSLEVPTVCPTSTPCPARFQLVSPTLDLTALQSAFLAADQSGELLRQIFSRIDRQAAQWPPLSGTIQIGALSSDKLVLHEVTGSVEVAGSSMTIRSLHGRVMNGAVHLAGTVEAVGGQPSYRLDVEVTNASPASIAALFGEQWGNGLLNFSAQLRMSGFHARDLAGSAAGTLRWDWNKGDLAPENAGIAEPFLHFDQWSGDGLVENSTIKITHSLLARGSEAIPFAGTISFAREIDLKSGSGAHAFSLTGTLEHPQVETVATEAQAHPAPRSAH